MNKNKKQEAAVATAGNVVGNIKGYQAPSTGVVKRKRIPEELKTFDEVVAYCEANNIQIETVKKRGESWVVFDDKTGAQKGVFKDRETAWQKQRQLRKQAKDHKKKKSDGKPKLAPKPKTAESKEHILSLFKEAIGNKLAKRLSEGSALSYVFEQNPVSKDSLAWNAFLEKLSQQTIFSDQKLKDILQNMAKMEVKLLANAVEEIKSILQKNGAFEVNQKKPDQDQQGNLMLNFEVLMPETKKKLQFFVIIEHGKPLIQFPEQTKNELNMLSNEESKALRAALMFAQEDALDKMEELHNITQKRDEYLNRVQEEIEKILGSLDPLKLVLMRMLLKTKYAGIK